MAIAASVVLGAVVRDMHDETSVAWSIAEIVGYLNDGKLAAASLRPDSVTRREPLVSIAGSLQTLPADATKLMRVLCNSAGTKRVVTKVDVALLDRSNPVWRGMTPVTEVLHYMFDPRDPESFEVYPPVSAGVPMEVQFAVTPPMTATPPPGSTVLAVVGPIGLPDLFALPLQHYVKARMHAREGQAGAAQAEFQMFTQMLGAEMTATLSAAGMNVSTATAVTPGG